MHGRTIPATINTLRAAGPKKQPFFHANRKVELARALPLEMRTQEDGQMSSIRTVAVGLALLAAGTIQSACSRDTQAMTPDQIERQYGVSGAHSETIVTADGTITGTVVPVTLANGTRADLVIPLQRADEPHAAYLRDSTGFHPVAVREGALRDDVGRAPAIVETRAEAPHAHKRSWEREVLIIGGSAGAGTAIGAIAGGQKGAAVGATAGGIGGLIYDLATRNKR